MGTLSIHKYAKLEKFHIGSIWGKLLLLSVLADYENEIGGKKKTNKQKDRQAASVWFKKTKTKKSTATTTTTRLFAW